MAEFKKDSELTLFDATLPRVLRTVEYKITRLGTLNSAKGIQADPDYLMALGLVSQLKGVVKRLLDKYLGKKA